MGFSSFLSRTKLSSRTI
uniref:Uncharacterized protein n=1 Tax=Anguilla anguilla TaxID=7936 RepID=A0A0E9SEE6_ANGAN